VIRSLRRAHGLKVGKVSDFFASLIISTLIFGFWFEHRTNTVTQCLEVLQIPVLTDH
jgi:hypothetical protein